MAEIFENLKELDLHHLNALLIIGLAIFLGTVGAKIFQKLRIPQVVGYIMIGLLLGGSFIGVIVPETIEKLGSFSMFALGIIGFMIGGELKFSIFKKFGKQFILIMLSEGLTAFFVVGVATTLLSKAVMPDASWSISCALGLLLGAIASATAPAATVDVLWEYKTRGPLTRTTLAIVALDDGLALLLFGFASSAAGALTGNGEGSFLMSLAVPMYEIFGSIVLGGLAALVLLGLLKLVNEPDKVLTCTLAMLLVVIGLSVVLKVESILASMVLGAVITNLRPRRSMSTFELIEKFAPPIYVLFFVLVGARLQIKTLELWVLVLAIAYVLGRTGGKWVGAWFGATMAKAPKVVSRYLGFCLFSQAGVAVGLSILASERFDSQIGGAIILIVTTTTFLVQIIGPGFVKVGVKLAGEIGMNVTEEDLIKTHTVGDMMETEPTVISDTMHLDDVLDTFANSKNSYFPVVDSGKKLLGIITISGIKETFACQKVAQWLLAVDIAQPVLDKVYANQSLEDAIRRMNKYELDFMVVVSDDGGDRLEGIIDSRNVKRRIQAEILRRKEMADSAS